MKKKVSSLVLFVILLSSIFSNAGAVFAESFYSAFANLDASQFITNVSVATTIGPVGSNKISDSSSVNVTYTMNIGDGSQIDTSQPYTMNLSPELKYETTMPIEITSTGGQKLASVKIIAGVVSITFEENVKSLNNINVYFNFWSTFNKSALDYDNGNDLAFPTKNDPENTIHINFSKSGSGGGSGESAVSKSLSYDKVDPTIVHWTITINNGGYEVADSTFKDIMQNTQEYIVGSTTTTFRNWNKQKLSENHDDLVFTKNLDGSQLTEQHYGPLTSGTEQNDEAITSILIRYETKLIYNAENLRYPNQAYSYDGTELIDNAVSTATYRGQGGGGVGDETTEVTGEKQWDDENNQAGQRPESIIVELLQNDQVYKETAVQADELGTWNYAFTLLPKNDESDQPYSYTVREKVVPEGYTSEVAGTTIINHYEAVVETTEITGEKQWDDANNQAGERPESIIVELLQNNQVFQEIKVQADEIGKWKYAFTDLPKNDESNQPYDYTVREKIVPEGYSSEVKGTTIINHFKQIDKESNELRKKSNQTPKKGSDLPLAGEKQDLFMRVAGLEVLLLWLLSYILSNRKHI